MLEDSLHEALDARAETYDEPDPGAWRKTMEKASARRRGRRVRLVALPALATAGVVLAAFLAVDAGREDVGPVASGAGGGHCRTLSPEGHMAQADAGMRVTYQPSADGTCLIWWLPDPSAGWRQLAWLAVDRGQSVRERFERRPATVGYRNNGVARSDAARVEVEYAGGVRVSAWTRPDPWGLGIVLFSAPAPRDEPVRFIMGYDRSGKELWRTDGAGVPVS